MQQKTFLFDDPIDALSLRFPTDETDVSLYTEEGWHQFYIEKEFDPLLQESDLITFEQSQYMVTLRGQLQDVTLHPIRVSTEPISYTLAAREFYRAPRILRRSEWGAKEGLLFAGLPSERSDVPKGDTHAPRSRRTLNRRKQPAQKITSSNTSQTRQDACNAAQKNHPADFATSRTITHDATGKAYRWPLRYSPDIKLLVLHHTAQKVTGDARPPAERMRALYEYHANSMGWGDIGYHYLIDEVGTIYEGRQGGENVVGGHAYCSNVGTIGIALMGNFELEQPTQTQVQSLQWLLDELARLYNMDLQQAVQYHGKTKQPIVGHNDVIATDCPGKYFKPSIAQIRGNVISGNVQNTVNFPRFTDSRRQPTKTLRKRVQDFGNRFSRRFYRTRRQVRTAARSGNTRLAALESARKTQNVQRRRSARTRRPGRPTRGLQSAVPASTNVVLQETKAPAGHIRILLSYPKDSAELFGSQSLNINGTRADRITLARQGNRCVAIHQPTTSNQQLILAEGIVRIDPSGGITTIDTWPNAYNRFRGVIECRVIDGRLSLINELPLEQYLMGLSEQPDTEPLEKQKAFAIAARSYAAHYMEPEHTKFPGKPYHGSDTGASFQSYSGVVYEQNNPNWLRAVAAVQHQVLKRNGEIVKAAYFSSDDGRTRSPEENGWKNFPHAEVFSSKADPWCKGFSLRGHGVGMSGCGAEGQANEGKTAQQILEYYYPGTTIERLQ